MSDGKTVSTTRPFNGGAVWVMGSYTPVCFFPGSCLKFCWWSEHTVYIVVLMNADERSSDPTRDWLRLACECPGVSGGGVSWRWIAAGLGTLNVAVCAWDLLKEVTITLHVEYINLHVEYMMWNAGLDEAQAGIKIAGRNINNLRYVDDTTLTAESKAELNSLLMKVKEESGKVGLKFNIQKTKIMASGLITSWQIDGEIVETETDFILGGSRITADGVCSHEIKRCLFLGRKAMTNLDSILKTRDLILPTKVHLVKAMVFPVVLYGCRSWTVKKAECRRIDAIELWCWRRLSESLETARISNQSILKEICPEYSLEGLMLKLKLQYFDVKNWLIWKHPDAGKDWGQEEKGMTEDEMVGWHHWLDGHEFEQALGDGDG